MACRVQREAAAGHGQQRAPWGVAALSTTEVWVVGEVNGSRIYPGQTLIEYWDGADWLDMSSPSPALHNDLYSVAAVLRGDLTDVWAVGEYYDSNDPADSHTLVEHWDGGYTWSWLPSPSPGAFCNTLYGVAGVWPSGDFWAVGGYNCSLDQTLVEHWSGGGWIVESSPNPGEASSLLHGVAAVSTTDVWAVGGYVTSLSAPFLSQSLIMNYQSGA